MIITYKKPFTFMSDYTSKIKEKCCFIGRLDPLASGISIFLTGEETKYQKEFLGLDKTYKFNLLLGLKTDTGDILGKILNYSSPNLLNFNSLNNTLNSFNNKKYLQKYQIFSSKTITKNGINKPLWYFAKKGDLNEEDIPVHEVDIYRLNWDYSEMSCLEFSDIRGDILKMKSLENSWQDFRCDEILPQYNEGYVYTLPCVAKVSSGTYIRQLCLDIGDNLGYPCCADKIERLSFHFREDLVSKYNLKVEEI